MAIHYFASLYQKLVINIRVKTWDAGYLNCIPLVF